MKMTRDPLEVLLVEDTLTDVLLTRQCLEDAGLPHNLHVTRDGVEAVRFLRREDEFSAAVRPDLILLDLNMPKRDGFSVLDEIKADDNLKRIPVVVLTTSNDQEDIDRAYNCHANSYLTKPVSFEQFVDEVARGIKEYWFKVVCLPSR